MDDVGKDALAILHGKVMRCPLILDVLFKYLNAKDLFQVRKVCTHWNAYALEMCRRKSVYFNVNMAWRTRVNKRQPCTSRDVHNFISEMQDDAFAKSILSVAKFNYHLGDYTGIGNARSMNLMHERSDDVIFLTEYGHLIKNLKIGVRTIDDLLKIFRLCKNLEILDIAVSYPGESIFGFTEVPDLNIVNRLTGEPTILENLHTFTLFSRLYWEFGPFLKLTAPNLRNIGHYGDQFDDRVHRHPSEYFARQLQHLNSGNIQSISFKCPGLQEGQLPSFFDKIMDFDWSSLARIEIELSEIWSFDDFETSSEMIKYLEFINRISTTLKSLCMHFVNGIPFLDEYLLPHFPKVTEATIHHSVINSPEFFQKLPALEELSLRSSYNDRRIEKADDKPEVLLRGFYIQNSSMWNDGSGWTPHSTLKNLDIDISPRDFVIPPTFGRMFPNLIQINVHAYFAKAFIQVQNLLNQVDNWPRLKTFSVPHTQDWILFPFILIGIPQVHWEAAQNRVNDGKLSDLKEFIAESPLTKLPKSATISLTVDRYEDADDSENEDEREHYDEDEGEDIDEDEWEEIEGDEWEEVEGDFEDIEGNFEDIGGDFEDIEGDFEDIEGDFEDIEGDFEDIENEGDDSENEGDDESKAKTSAWKVLTKLLLVTYCEDDSSVKFQKRK